MNRNTAWVVSMVVGLGAGACSGARDNPNPLESPLGEIQTAGAPQTVVRIADAFKDQDWIRDIAIVDNDLYVTVAWSGVYRLPKFGGGITPIDVSADAEVDALASGDGAVFWERFTFGSGDAPTLYLRRVAAGDTAVSTIHQEGIGGYEDYGRNLQVDGSTVYMTELSGVTNLGAIHRFPTTGGAELPSIAPFTYPAGGGYISGTDLHRVWIARSGGIVTIDCPLNSDTCTIQRVTGDGTQPIAAFPGREAYVGAIDETSIYFTSVIYHPTPAPSSVTTPLLKIDQQTGEITQVTPDSGGGYTMLDGGQELFYVSGAFRISAVSKQGGDPRTVADLTGSNGIWRMVQDDTHLFVLTAQSEVVAIPKGTPAAAQP
jgi:hypothetical protein